MVIVVLQDDIREPILTYGAETLTLTNATARKLKVTQRKMERSMLGVTLRDHIRNEDLRKRTGVEDVITVVARLKWNWAGHVARMRGDRWTKRLLEWRPRADKRSRGRPPTRWTDDIKRISDNWKNVSAPYESCGHFEAELIAESNNRKELLTLKQKLEAEEKNSSESTSKTTVNSEITVISSKDDEKSNQRQEDDLEIFNDESSIRNPGTAIVFEAPSPNVKCRRMRWSEEEKRIASEGFKEYIMNNTLPSFQKIHEVMNTNPGVFQRSVATIKTWIKNEKLKKSREGIK
ncbi:uncharacterized protein LOC123311716 [Coccinella septempunctata]|uniref:uncharacterized protein LOC123311716 n=1 Tax=Coccinella septempunctata TaxID=41139 RepID=UPI001D086B4D|nr:uncharacterized protein LOC123311716 [Coccinella septempunctata]